MSFETDTEREREREKEREKERERKKERKNNMDRQIDREEKIEMGENLISILTLLFFPVYQVLAPVEASPGSARLLTSLLGRPSQSKSRQLIL